MIAPCSAIASPSGRPVASPAAINRPPRPVPIAMPSASEMPSALEVAPSPPGSVIAIAQAFAML
ncbi:hypothetical protein D3C83_230860 [compost metagenome]